MSDEKRDALARAPGSALAREEDGSRSRVRLWLRGLFEGDANVREIILAASPAAGAKEHLTQMLEGSVAPGSEAHLSPVLDELLAELEEQRREEPGLYLVDGKTGKAMMRLQGEAIYQPPDYVGEDGIRRRARPVLHPGIAAPMTMAAFEKGRLEEASSRPEAAMALRVIHDPGSMVRAAEARLVELGYEVGQVDGGISDEVEVGREYYDPLQSQNDSFHRHSVFGAALASKVAGKMGRLSRRCEIMPPVPERNSKQRWYRVAFRHA